MSPEQVQTILWFGFSVAALVTGLRTFLRARKADKRRQAQGENGSLRLLSIARVHRTGLGLGAAIAGFAVTISGFLIDDVTDRMPIARTFFLLMSLLWAVRNIVEDWDDVDIENEIRIEQSGGH